MSCCTSRSLYSRSIALAQLIGFNELNFFAFVNPATMIRSRGWQCVVTDLRRIGDVSATSGNMVAIPKAETPRKPPHAIEKELRLPETSRNRDAAGLFPTPVVATLAFSDTIIARPYPGTPVLTPRKQIEDAQRRRGYKPIHRPAVPVTNCCEHTAAASGPTAEAAEGLRPTPCSVGERNPICHWLP